MGNNSVATEKYEATVLDKRARAVDDIDSLHLIFIPASINVPGSWLTCTVTVSALCVRKRFILLAIIEPLFLNALSSLMVFHIKLTLSGKYIWLNWMAARNGRSLIIPLDRTISILDYSNIWNGNSLYMHVIDEGDAMTR